MVMHTHSVAMFATGQLIDSLYSQKQCKPNHEQYFSPPHSWNLASWEERAGQDPTLVKPCLLYPSPKISTSPMTQLHHLSIAFCRNTRLTRNPSMPVYGLTTPGYIWVWVLYSFSSPGNQKISPLKPQNQQSCLEFLDYAATLMVTQKLIP